MLIVLDDVLDEASRIALVNFFSSGHQARAIKWQSNTLSNLQTNQLPTGALIKIAAKFFDLTPMIGHECWAHYGTRPDWHIDKDEKLKKIFGEEVFPLCSIVYYADINVTGGEFMTESITVKPATNRLVLFSPGILHCVKEYTGTRLSVAINPWDKVPMQHA